MLIVTIGRHASCDIVLDDEHISQKHAILYIHDNGDMFLEDNASSNGTFIGDRSFPVVVRAPVTANDTVYFSTKSIVMKDLLEYVRKKRLGKHRADVIRCPYCWIPVEVSRKACPNCTRSLEGQA
jgi:pSer/pThr/pTyr-binding forkhead associated (FHA) protein